MIQKMQKQRPSINLLGPLFVALPVLLLGIVLSYIWHSQSRNSVQKLSDIYIYQIHTLVKNTINDILALPPRITKINESLLNEGYLDPNDLDSWRNTFTEEFLAFDLLSTIVWGDADGRAAWIARYGDGNIYWAIKDDPESSTMLEWRLDTTGHLINSSPKSFDYNLFSRPWFVGPRELGIPTWSGPFLWEGGESSEGVTIGISYGIPIYDEDKNLKGIMDTDFSLNDLSRYLETINIGESGVALLTSSDGLLLASSNAIKNIHPDRRLSHLIETDNLFALATHKFLVERNLGKEETSFPITGKLSVANDSISITVSKIGMGVGLDWNLITLVPDKDFLAEIDQSYYNSVLISIFAVIFALLFGLYASKWILKPLTQLIQFTKRISDGNLDQSIKLKHTPEYEELGNAINAMLLNLKESREHEILLSRELDHRAKNMLAQIVSICRQSASKATADSALLDDLTTRVIGIASIHELLAASKQASIGILALLDACCQPYIGNAKGRIQSQGNDMELNSKAVLCIGMVFNELANNSLKHGAFSREDGSVEVNWETTKSDETDILKLEWIEAHGGVIPESIDGGLGSKVLRLAIPYELEGTAEITVIENGIHFKTSIPIESIKVN